MSAWTCTKRRKTWSSASLPVAPTYNTVNQYLVKPWVKGLKPTPQDMVFPGSYSVTAIDMDTAAMP